MEKSELNRILVTSNKQRLVLIISESTKIPVKLNMGDVR